MKKELGLVCWMDILWTTEKAKDRATLLRLLGAFFIRWDSYVDWRL